MPKKPKHPSRAKEAQEAQAAQAAHEAKEAQAAHEASMIFWAKMYSRFHKLPYQLAIDHMFNRKFDERDRELIAAGIDPLLMRILAGLGPAPGCFLKDVVCDSPLCTTCWSEEIPYISAIDSDLLLFEEREKLNTLSFEDQARLNAIRIVKAERASNSGRP